MPKHADKFQLCRPNDRRYVVKHGMKLHNDMVVPYNPSLLLKYDCHMNVEVVSNIHSVKYLFKYVYKGHDKAMMRLMRRPYHQHAAAPEKNPDEVERYLDCRCAVVAATCIEVITQNVIGRLIVRAAALQQSKILIAM